MPRAVVLVNPRSRSGARPPLGRILDAFTGAGWQAEVWAGSGLAWTEAASWRARRLGFEAVFGAGGDGLLARILPAVLGSEVALGTVPLGTGNVWARELGLPLEPARAIAAQLARPPARVDLGRANGRPFLVIASAGVDAGIVELVEADPATKALGQLAYPLAGLRLAAGLRGVPARVSVDDQPPLELELLAAIATNGRLYGGLVPLVPAARVDDGALHLVLFPGRGPLDATGHTARALMGLHLADPSVVVRRVRASARVETLPGAPPLPVQTDGDPAGTTPLVVEPLPGALLALGAPPRG